MGALKKIIMTQRLWFKQNKEVNLRIQEHDTLGEVGVRQDDMQF